MRSAKASARSQAPRTRRHARTIVIASAAAESAMIAHGGRKGEKAIDQTLNGSAFR